MVIAQTALPVDIDGDSVLVRYYADLRTAARLYRSENGTSKTPGLAMDPELPELTEPLAQLLGTARMRMVGLGSHAGRELRLLDLRCTASTRTTKTFASVLIVARAVAHIQRTCERVMIVTPTSANKGTALRDAVLRAIRLGLVSAEQLSIAVVAPAESLPKLWASELSEDSELLRRNPILLYDGERTDGVKALAAEFVRAAADSFEQDRGVQLWYTMDLANYIVADTARAFFEADVSGPAPQGRLHAHAVSSAFGLLGYHLGRRVRHPEPDPDHPQFLLVQHLRTSDMVTSLLRARSGGEIPPRYVRDESVKVFAQQDDPHFPAVTDSPTEDLDSTFYTRQPATSPTMNAIIERHGGDGIVVSRRECLARYDELRARLAAVDIALPADAAALREWSLVMALTGVMNAIERGLVPAGVEVVVHGSGSYSTDDYVPLSETCTTRVRTAADLEAPLTKAAL
ncbi:DUF6002 family protein [Nocardia sp. NPDC004604]|uniref:DUF6002 family protein n=1 Tax=Nocardia sp. NPDC004604 TaxID=3157013 RepID=UPI0033B07455